MQWTGREFVIIGPGGGPASRGEFPRLRDACLLDTTSFELSDEFDKRPHLAEMPLCGILGLTGGEGA